MDRFYEGNFFLNPLNILIMKNLGEQGPDWWIWPLCICLTIIIQEFTSKFLSKFGIRDPLNFANMSKWNSKTRPTCLQILVESKVLILAPSNIAKNDARDFHFIRHEFTSNFFLQIWDQGSIEFCQWVIMVFRNASDPSSNPCRI